MKYNIGILFLIWTISLRGQELITLQQAIDSALSKNLNITIVRNELEIAQNNNNPGNAGMLPSLVLNVGETPANSNIRQEFLNGTVIQRDGVSSNNFNAQLALTMTLFDGGKMFATQDRLRELEFMGEQNLAAEIQNIVSAVIQSYTRMIAFNQYMVTLNRSVAVGEASLNLIKLRKEAGLANDSDVMLATIDLEQRRQALISQQIATSNTMKDLNVLTQSDVNRRFKVEESIRVNESLLREELDPLFRENPEFILSGSSKRVALYAEKEAKSSMYPRVGLTAAYGYSLNQSEAGFSLYNQSFGPLATLTLSVPLFSGNVNRINYANAKLQLENAELQNALLTAELQSQYEKAWDLYESSKLQVKAEMSNIKLADSFLTIMEQRMNNGQSTVLEFREAQRSFEEANFRFINQQAILKSAETDLLRLTGKLLK